MSSYINEPINKFIDKCAINESKGDFLKSISNPKDQQEFLICLTEEAYGMFNDKLEMVKDFNNRLGIEKNDHLKLVKEEFNHCMNARISIDPAINNELIGLIDCDIVMHEYNIQLNH